LQEQLPRDENQRSAGFILDRYLDNLTSYAETVCDAYSDRSDGLRPISRAGSSGEDGPINEIESTLRAISSTPRELDSNSHDEGKERDSALARVKAFEPRVEAARDEEEEKEARLVAQRAEIEASKAREQRRLKQALREHALRAKEESDRELAARRRESEIEADEARREYALRAQEESDRELAAIRRKFEIEADKARREHAPRASGIDRVRELPNRKTAAPGREENSNHRFHWYLRKGDPNAGIEY